MSIQHINYPLRLLSFDIEEWFLARDVLKIPVEKWPTLPVRVIENTKIILQLLNKHQQKAVFYVLGWIAEQYPDLIKLIVKEGHTIGYHSYYHQRPEEQDKSVFEEDLVKGLSLLEKISGLKITHYRAPLFSLNKNSLWIVPILLKHGIKVSSSTKSGVGLKSSKVPYQPFCFETEGHKLIELPLSRVRLFGQDFVYSGSGYLRILPKAIVQYLFKSRNYTLAYFHPRDFDVNVPKAKELGRARNFLNSLGNNTTYHKLDILLKRFEFLSPEQLQIKIDQQCSLNKIQVILTVEDQ